MTKPLRQRVCLGFLLTCVIVGCAFYYYWQGSDQATLLNDKAEHEMFHGRGSVYVTPSLSVANVNNRAAVPPSRPTAGLALSAAEDDVGFDDVNRDSQLTKSTEASPDETSGAMRCAEAALPGLHAQMFDPSKIVGAHPNGSTLPPEMRVPHVIHQIWQSEFVHHSLAEYIKSWPRHNPGWTHVLWTHSSARMLTAKMFPQYLHMYDAYGADIYRADVARYFILYTFGGVYMDLDIESLRPLDLVDRHSCFISQEPNVHQSLLHKRNTTMASNAFMGCRKEHPFFRYIIHGLPEFAKKTDDLLGSTGPLMLDKTYKDYFTSHSSRRARDDVLVAPGPFFQPSFDENNRGMLKKTCSLLTAPYLNPSKCEEFLLRFGPAVLARQVNDCKELIAKDFDNKPESYSYSNHHWVHSYWYPYKFHGKNIGSNVNYADLVPGVIPGAELVENLTT